MTDQTHHDETKAMVLHMTAVTDATLAHLAALSEGMHRLTPQLQQVSEWALSADHPAGDYLTEAALWSYQFTGYANRGVPDAVRDFAASLRPFLGDDYEGHSCVSPEAGR